MNLADALVTKRFNTNDRIIKQGMYKAINQTQCRGTISMGVKKTFSIIFSFIHCDFQEMLPMECIS